MTPLSPLAWLYGLATKLRNALYDRQIFKSYHPGVRVISIGNLTTGGTGKTPLVALTAKLLAKKGEKVCVLTRGYGRKDPGRQVLVSDGERVLADATTGGDEPVELARKLIGKAAVIADRDRLSASAWAKENLGSTCFVLDDGFQHRRIKRDIDIVCVDATDPFGNGELLPEGRLREGKSSLNRANAVVITRADLVDDTAAIEREIAQQAPAAKIFRSRSRLCRIVELKGYVDESPKAIDLASLPTVFAFCAIGNPSAFFRQLRSIDLRVGGSKAFRDHHRFTSSDVTDFEDAARRSKCEVLVTTAKDAVRLTNLVFSMPCYVVEMEIEIDDIDEFQKLISSS